eukprot:CAMPEP_0194569440 /NCGR_PEP_ID=MMETSP0292-20121207/7153_1 /TAXON_ID=39354 /ORGANISM="Heterosigma akashiwo, Strain CCMP2393" /LENGTH=73 /DNA_ID=CAMNT_0039419687 /DNA_START=29 /DNA_END=250 /DNA_ORIENTATION=+
MGINKESKVSSKVISKKAAPRKRKKLTPAQVQQMANSVAMIQAKLKIVRDELKELCPEGFPLLSTKVKFLETK